MKNISENYNGIYADMIEILGVDITIKIFKYYKGQQITLPMRLYSKGYVIKYLKQNYDGDNLKVLSRNLSYSERWLKKIIDDNIGKKTNDNDKEEEVK